MEHQDILLQTLLDLLEKRNIITKIGSGVQFFDEPRYYYFAATLQNKPTKSNSISVNTFGFGVGGLSFVSKRTALIRCLAEAVERYCLCRIDLSKLSFSLYQNNDLFVDITKFASDPKKKYKYGWIKGSDINGKAKFIPAQLVYLNYFELYKEPQLDSSISTGGAAGQTHIRTLLSGINEVIERDAFMVSYLKKIPDKKINILSVKSEKIQKIYEYLHRYKLKWHLFNISVDFDIPVFLSIVIDETGLGPAINIGSKAGLDLEDSIISSVEEAIMVRPWSRYVFTTHPTWAHNPINYISSRTDHIMYWYSTDKINKLNWWLRQKEVLLDIENKYTTIEEQYNHTVKKIINRNFQIYYVDLAPDFIKKSGLLVYKVIIPGLQTLYFNENKREVFLNKTRLSSIGSPTTTINSVPHPFI